MHLFARVGVTHRSVVCPFIHFTLLAYSYMLPVLCLFRILANSSDLWKNICQTAKDNGQLGDTLVLRCENHPGQEVDITSAKVHTLRAAGSSKDAKTQTAFLSCF